MDKIRDLALIAVGVMIVGVLVFVTSCQGNPKPAPSPGPTLESSKVQIAAIGHDLGETTHNIKTASAEGEKQTPAAIKPTLSPFWATIWGNAERQEGLVNQLKTQEGELSHAKALSQALERDRDAQRGRAEKAEASTRQALSRALNWLIVASILGIGVCVVLLFTGQKLAVYGGVGCAAVVGISIAVQALSAALPWLVGGFGALAVGFVVYDQIIERRAVAELVHTGEITKTVLSPAGKASVYGDGPIQGQADHVQSATTRKLVKSIRTSGQVPLHREQA